MSTWAHLPKAPITEALIDIRVRLPEGTHIQGLSPFRDEVRADYPTCRERRRGHVQLVFPKTEPPTIQVESNTPDGYLLTSADGREVVQVRLDGFTFSRLKPYQTWNQLRDAARALWNSYCRIAKPTLITRVAVRYINRLELPLPLSDFREWICIFPEIASTLPQGLAGFFLRVSIPFDKPRGFVNLTQAIEPGEHGRHVPLIFDIDTFLPDEFDPRDEAVWERFEDLRTIKNRVFFESITEKTKEMYL